MRYRSESRSHAEGFTLVEVMATVAILAVLVMLAGPRFGTMIQRMRTTTLTNELVTSLNYARSEASRRGLPVSLCPAGANGEWEEGWTVTTGDDCAAGEVLRIWDPPPASLLFIPLDGDGGQVEAVTFGPLGQRVSPAATFNMGFDGCEGESARRVGIGAGGRVGVTYIECQWLTELGHE